MPIDWAPFVDFVNCHQHFLLTTHVRPDGDGLGSMLALDSVLRRKGKRVQLAIASSVPPRYDFLHARERVQLFEMPGDEFKNTEAILVLDTGTWNQLGDVGLFLRGHRAAKAVIDHHLTQDDLGAQRFVDASAEATGRLVFEAINALGEPITPEVANSLFVALAMDTGWFVHANTHANTFALAGQLVAAGARNAELHVRLFESDRLERLKLKGSVLDRLQVMNNGKLAYSEIQLVDYKRTGTMPQDSEDFVNLMLSIKGVEVGLLFMEQPRGGVKVSFRSRAAVDVARIAEQFGGGGHRLASGATIEAPLEEARARVLHAVSSALAATV
jgi:phosphoesterase RecJ-like protein